ncbi:FecR family protein [Chitinophaga ginsengisoli]|uniref:FecR family protein n=1 Tax=Chitinophaga ginsengisoli TaxID=363837 RepID=A0A2P8G2B1_9BACT|nr:FecR family protein [Chitinophaga ginsengisoli]PSL28086.1 FecR family protein [Chitinophaga ginsengisoli]
MDEALKIHAEILFTKEYVNEITEQEKVELRTLVSGNPEIRLMYDRHIARIESGLLPKNPPKRDVSAALVMFNQRKQSHLNRRRNFRYLVAASIILLITAPLFFLLRKSDFGAKLDNNESIKFSNSIKLKAADGIVYLLGSNNGKKIERDGIAINDSSHTLTFNSRKNNDYRLNDLFVPSKLDYTLVLSDGSSIHLNSSTTLKFPFNFPETAREIYVDGEAYITVKTDPNRPFIVHTEMGDIKVLGTNFNINTYKPGIMIASLVSGSIIINRKNEEIIAKPGFEVVSTLNHPAVTRTFEPKMTLSWMDGIFFFNHSSMREIADVIPRWFDVSKIVIDDNELAAATFTGSINKKKPLDIFLKALEKTSALRYYYVGSELHLKSVK